MAVGRHGGRTARRGALAPLLLFLLLVPACSSGGDPAAGPPVAPGPGAPAAGAVAPSPAPAPVVDSILPLEEEIRRFREMAPGIPTRLEGGAASRDALVRRWVRAIETSDTTAIRGMLLSAEEFITFYYPASRFTGGPYRQSPRLLWFLMSSNSSQGATRVLQRHGGQPFGFRSYACGTEETLGAMRTWSDCRIQRRLEDGRDAEMRFFGGIIERGGTFKFLSYASDY